MLSTSLRALTRRESFKLRWNATTAGSLSALPLWWGAFGWLLLWQASERSLLTSGLCFYSREILVLTPFAVKVRYVHLLLHLLQVWEGR